MLSCGVSVPPSVRPTDGLSVTSQSSAKMAKTRIVLRFTIKLNVKYWQSHTV